MRYGPSAPLFGPSSATNAPDTIRSTINDQLGKCFGMRGVLILLMFYVLMLATRGEHQKTHLTRPTAFMPPY